MYDKRAELFFSCEVASLDDIAQELEMLSAKVLHAVNAVDDYQCKCWPAGPGKNLDPE